MLRNRWILPMLTALVLVFSNCGDANSPAAKPAGNTTQEALTMMSTVPAEATAGKVVFVELWGAWCPPCIRSMPHVQEVWEHYKGNEQFEMMVVNTGWRGDTPDKVKGWLKANSKYSFPVYFENRPQPQQFAAQHGVNSIPRSLIFNKKGEVAYNGHPMQVPEGLIDQLLAE